MNVLQKLLIPILLFQCLETSAQMIEITDFGNNSGNLKMFLFEPSNPKTDAEVVLVLHGCGQNASNFAEQTGWNVLAEQYGFYVIFAEQKVINNPTRCFNWFLSSDNERDIGEAKSLIDMVNYVHNNFSTDNTKNFVCGLSAGGAMTPVMLACYPDVFKSGGTWAGVPYLYEPTGNNDITPMEWGDKVRNAFSSYSGAYPTLFICQGTDDTVTEPINESRLVAQWTNIHDSDQIPDETELNFNGNADIEENIYLNNSNDTIIKSYTIQDMGHGIAVDPGNEIFQGGQTSAGSYDVDFYSTYWMARFFGLIPDDMVNSVQQIYESEIETYINNDGSLKITTNENLHQLQMILFDISGRRILTQNFNQETIISSSQLNNNRIIIISIYNKNKKRVYSKLLVRN
ncbi:extracellular catalytic domain type 1 short-chain-length polyhydroxyalkanoate depolymerase [Lewinella cohaerens]|uniref:extracellular catalytic domain type 1 short-chain-length polyhydroxyalkanoate depolymerase n=1 Tax=Lewinella cohaerens TaxID=70995 RepID=UPI00036D6257|nr:PHB depolymerase family esterase [Lewinella cohaerens]